MAVPTEKARKSGKRNDFVTMMTHYYKSAEKITEYVPIKLTERK